MRTRCIHFSVLALSIVLQVFAAQVAYAQNSAQPRRLDIVHSASAHIVLAEGRELAVFTDADLAYEELSLHADRVEYDSGTETVVLSGNVDLAGPDYGLTAPACTIALREGLVSAADGVSLTVVREGVTASAQRGDLEWEPATYQPLRATLAGEVSAEWKQGVTLQGQEMSFDFTGHHCSVTAGFTAFLPSSLLSESLRRLMGEGLQLAGENLFVQIEQGESRRMLLTANLVEVTGAGAGVRGSNLTANFALDDDDETALEQGFFSLTGSSEDPVIGWYHDERGTRMDFSAQGLTKPFGCAELTMGNNVRIVGDNFVLCAKRVLVAPAGEGVRVRIPERFRAEISPEVFRAESEAGSPATSGV